MPTREEELISTLSFTHNNNNNNNINMDIMSTDTTKNNDEQGETSPSPIILEGTGWKRRSGFGKFSVSSWERRRLVLTPSKLDYYSADEESKSAKARGTLAILPEKATITATYPGDSSQPTPYAVDVKTIDGVTKLETFKWKLCFDDRETQLIWLVALTDIVATASVKEYNANVLAAEQHKMEHGGFHRLYEEGDGRLLDLVHKSLMTGSRPSKKLKSSLKDSTSRRGGIELVQHSTRVDISDETELTSSTSARSSSSTSSPVSASHDANLFNNKGKQEGKADAIPVDKLYQALAVVVVSILFERSCVEESSSHLWQLVNVIILYICFGDLIYAKKAGGDKKEGVKEDTNNRSSGTKQVKIAPTVTGAPSLTSVNMSMTKSMVGAELMKAESVPLSTMPSMRVASKESDELLEGFPDDDGRLHRPLTEDEMKAHKHERWAMAAPDVDLSGEWTLIADETFKREYDAYLKQLGFSGITRKVACGLIARTTEMTKQTDNGRSLYLKGTNPKGAWERTLASSGYPDFETEPHHQEDEDYSHHNISIKTADSEDVNAEGWWEDAGKKHRSWLRGGKKYGGGDFESLRFIEEGSDGNVLVCESYFHSNDKSKGAACVNWRFQRD